MNINCIPKECLLQWRKNTFKNWQFDKNNSPCTSTKLAEAGFYRTNPKSDSLKCFMCLKELDGWDSKDIPLEEHKKHAPYCPFMKFGLYENLTVEQISKAEIARLVCHNTIKTNDDLSLCINVVSDSLKELKNTDKPSTLRSKRLKK